MTSTTKKFQICLFAFASFFSLATGAQPPDHRYQPGKLSSKKLDHSGQPRFGKASYYAKKFAGRKMADGTPMNPASNAAASKTLPLGTKAEVVNLDNGKSAVVEIRDRGPHIDGRIVDLTPTTARQLDIMEKGVATVQVTPLEVPQPDGSVKRLVASR